VEPHARHIVIDILVTVHMNKAFPVLQTVGSSTHFWCKSKLTDPLFMRGVGGALSPVWCSAGMTLIKGPPLRSGWFSIAP